MFVRLQSLALLVAAVALMTSGLPAEAHHDDTFEIRPGQRIDVLDGLRVIASGCTANFVYVAHTGDGRTSGPMIGTAGHCTDAVGNVVKIDRSPVPVGEIIYREIGETGLPDFALAEIFPEFAAAVNPAVCYWGGPTGMYADFPTEPGQLRVFGAEEATLKYYGWGGPTDPTLRPRMGRIILMDDDEIEVFLGDTRQGDSGSPILFADGRAIGMVQSGLVQMPLIPGPSGATSVPYDVARAEAALGVDLELRTAPLRDVPFEDQSCKGSSLPDFVVHSPSACDLGVLTLVEGSRETCEETIPADVRDPPWP